MIKFIIKKYSFILKLTSVWIMLFLIGLLLLELYTRKVQGYKLLSISLVKKSNFYPAALRKEFNKEYYKNNKANFKNWPIRVAMFDPVEKIGTATERPAYLFKPNYLEKDKDGKIIWSTNFWGFRGKELSMEKAANTIRVVCLGSSTTQGGQIEEETYPYFLQKELEKRYPQVKFEVINAGHEGLNSQDLLVILIHRIFPLDPDLVIYYEMGNGVDEKGPLKVNYSDVIFWNYLDRYSAIYRLIEEKYQVRLPSIDYSYDLDKYYSSLEKIMGYLEKIVQESKKRNAKIVLVSPISGFHKSLWSDAKISFDLYWMYRRWYPIKPEDIDRWYQNLGKHYQKITEKYAIPYIDITDNFPKDIKYYAKEDSNRILDPSHYSVEGNKLLANLIADHLIDKLNIFKIK